MNSVKILVRESALDLREFNVDQMVKATGAKPPSVKNEIGRMVDDGYLIAQPSSGPHQRRGKPSSIYRLTDDKEKVERLISEVTSFRPQRRRLETRPRSRNFEVARQYLDRAATASESEQKALLDEAEHSLRVAWAEEGETAPVKDAFIQYEQGRLFFLRKNYEQAGPLLEEAAGTFKKHPGYENEYATALQLCLSNVLERYTPITQPASGLHRGVKVRPSVHGRASGPLGRTAIANMLQRLSAALNKDEINAVQGFPLGKVLIKTFKTVANSISPQKQLLGSAWDCLAVRGVSQKLPTRHESWKFSSLGDRCVIKFEPNESGSVNIVRKPQVIRKGKRVANREIDVAVRGPDYLRDLRLTKFSGLKRM